MTQSHTSIDLDAPPSDLLKTLKDLKNSVIGNTWKKVEVAEDEELLAALLSLLDHTELDTTRTEIIIETAVILGALANVGALTLRPLLQTSTPAHLLSLIKSLTSLSISSTSPPSPQASVARLLPPLLRALRNVLITTADLVWGHMWGVGAEKKVVGTGLVGEETIGEDVGGGVGGGGVLLGKGKGNGKGRSWRVEATRALSLSFEPTNLNTLISLIQRHPDTQILLPLYQLFSRLIALPSHRDALARWQPLQDQPTRALPQLHPQRSFAAGPSSLRQIQSSASSSPAASFILDHLLDTISASYSSPAGRRANGKILEAALDLLAALVKGQPGMAATIRSWKDETVLPLNRDDMEVEPTDTPLPTYISITVDMLLAGPVPVRIAAANCLTNILKADKTTRTYERIRASVMNLQLLDVIIKLLKSEGLEERVKLCFILAALVSDDGHLQKSAADQGCPALLVTMIINLDRDEQNGEMGADIASRSKEAVLLALAALSFSHEPTRTLLAETSPPFLPYLHKALSNPSYGVRAAACQLARALSRTIAILRTSLVDSGVGEEVIETLKREVEARTRKHSADGFASADRNREMDGVVGIDEEDDMGERAWTVEVAATATICNLITDFSPLKGALLQGGGVELLCQLAHSSYEPLALNALWAIKNLIFRAIEPLKNSVMRVLGWDTLRYFIGRSSPLHLRIQALEITQNLLADAIPSEVSRCLDSLGESEFLDVLAGAAREGEDAELRVPALFVLANLALGNERTRSAIVAKVEIVEILSEAMNAKLDTVKVPAIRTVRHLVESNAKTHRPRQAMLDLFQPYQLKPRLKDLAETSPSLDVCQAAIGLLEVLDRGKDSGGERYGNVTVGSAPK